MSKLKKSVFSITLVTTVLSSLSPIINFNEVANAQTINESQFKLKQLVPSSVTDLSNPDLENAKVVNVDDLGAVPNDGKDDSQAIQKALDMNLNEAIRLKFSPGEYIIDNPNKVNTEVIGSKGIYLDGDNTVFKPKNHLTNPPEFFALQIHMDKNDNKGFKAEGITVDGSLNPQNQHFTMGDKLESYGGDASGFYKTAMVKGFRISHAQKVDMNDMTFKHMYGGYAVLIDGHKNVDIQDVFIDDVGGDDITDSFGMFYYFGGTPHDNAVVNIDKTIANGKVGDEPQSNPGTGRSNPGDKSYYSWIGVVDENGSIQSDNEANWLKDKNTTFNITNAEFYDVETTFHTESKYGNTYFNANNIKTRAKDYFIYAGINGEHKTVSNLVDAEIVPFGRNNIVKGTFYSEKELADNNSGLNTNLVTNSTFNYPWMESTPHAPGSSQMLMATNYGEGTPATYKCDTFNGVPDGLVANAPATFIDSAINLHANNPRDAKAGALTIDDIKGYPEAYQVTATNTSINHSNEWKTAGTCETPQFVGPSGYKPDELTKPVDPADIGGENTQTPNIAPTINVSDITIEQGQEFDPKAGITVTDDKDTNLPVDVEGTVDTSTPGEYTLKYTTKDSDGAVTVTERKVTVKEKDVPTTEVSTTEKPTTEAPTTEKPTTEAPTTEEATTEKPTTETPTTEEATTEKPTTETPTTEEPEVIKPTTDNQAPRIFANDKVITEGSKFDPIKDVEAWDKEDGDLTSSLKLVSGSVDTSKPGDYDLTYEISDSEKTTTKTTVTITVLKNWSSKIVELEKKIQDLEAQLKDVKTSSDVYKKDIEAIKTQITEIQTKINNINQNYDTLKNDMNSVKGEIKDISVKYNELQEKLSALSSKDAEQQKVIDNLNATVIELGDKLEELIVKFKSNNAGIIINNTNINNNNTTTDLDKESNLKDTKSTKKATSETQSKKDSLTMKESSLEDKTTEEPKQEANAKTDSTIDNKVDDIRKPEQSGTTSNTTTEKANNDNTEVVTSETTKTDDIKKPSNSILPDTGNKSLNYLLYAGVPILLIGACGYMIYRRKVNQQ